MSETAICIEQLSKRYLNTPVFSGLSAQFPSGRIIEMCIRDRDVTITGPYGWKIDQAAETQSLIAAIQTCQSSEREPVYALSLIHIFCSGR